MLSRTRGFNSLVSKLLPAIPNLPSWPQTKQKLFEAVDLNPTSKSLFRLINELAKYKRYDTDIWQKLIDISMPRLSKDPQLVCVLCMSPRGLLTKSQYDEIEGELKKLSSNLAPKHIARAIIGFNKADQGSRDFWVLTSRLLSDSCQMNTTLFSQAILAIAKRMHSVPMSDSIWRFIKTNKFNSIGVTALLAACVEAKSDELTSLAIEKMNEILDSIKPRDFCFIVLHLKQLGKLADYQSLIVPQLVYANEPYLPDELILLFMTFRYSNEPELKRRMKRETMASLPTLKVNEISSILHFTGTDQLFNNLEMSALANKALDDTTALAKEKNLMTIAHALHKNNIKLPRLLSLVNESFLQKLTADDLAIFAFAVRIILKEPEITLLRSCVETQFQHMNAKHIINMAVMWTEARFYSQTTWQLLEPHYQAHSEFYIENTKHSDKYLMQSRVITSRLVFLRE